VIAQTGEVIGTLQKGRRSKGRGPTEAKSNNLPDRASARLEIIPATFMMFDNLRLHKLKRLTRQEGVDPKVMYAAQRGVPGLLFMQAGDAGSLAKAPTPFGSYTPRLVRVSFSILASLKNGSD
jgi:hypothetical protein